MTNDTQKPSAGALAAAIAAWNYHDNATGFVVGFTLTEHTELARIIDEHTRPARDRLAGALRSCLHLAERDAREQQSTEFAAGANARLDKIRAALREAGGEA